jgi:hypothetical protein
VLEIFISFGGAALWKLGIGAGFGSCRGSTYCRAVGNSKSIKKV